MAGPNTTPDIGRKCDVTAALFHTPTEHTAHTARNHTQSGGTCAFTILVSAFVGTLSLLWWPSSYSFLRSNTLKFPWLVVPGRSCSYSGIGHTTAIPSRSSLWEPFTPMAPLLFRRATPKPYTGTAKPPRRATPQQKTSWAAFMRMAEVSHETMPRQLTGIIRRPHRGTPRQDVAYVACTGRYLDDENIASVPVGSVLVTARDLAVFVVLESDFTRLDPGPLARP